MQDSLFTKQRCPWQPPAPKGESHALKTRHSVYSQLLRFRMETLFLIWALPEGRSAVP